MPDEFVVGVRLGLDDGDQVTDIQFIFAKQPKEANLRIGG